MGFRSSSAEKNQTIRLLIGHCSSFMLGLAAISCEGPCPWVWRVNLEITPVPCSGHVCSDLIIFSLGPTLKNVRLAYTQKNPRQNVPLTWLKGKKSKALIWWRKFGLLSILNEAERKVFSKQNFKYQRKQTDKYALWWVENLSDSTVFLTLETFYQIYNCKFSQSHALEPIGSTLSVVVEEYSAQRAFKKKTSARNTEDCKLWMRNLTW